VSTSKKQRDSKYQSGAVKHIFFPLRKVVRTKRVSLLVLQKTRMKSLSIPLAAQNLFGMTIFRLKLPRLSLQFNS
jgi:hypothetical protein